MFEKRVVAACVAVFVQLTAAGAGAQDWRAHVLFHAPLDGSAAFDGKGRRIEGRATKRVIFCESVFSGAKALDASRGDSMIRFPVKGHINLMRGTIMLWIKPVAWPAVKPGWIPFLDLAHSKGCMRLMRGHPGAQHVANTNLYLYFHSGKWELLSGPYDGWHNGKWTHIAVTWEFSKSDILRGTLYANGVPQRNFRHNHGKPTGNVPGEVTSELAVGGNLSGSTRARAALADLYILDRPLEANAVREVSLGFIRKVAAERAKNPRRTGNMLRNAGFEAAHHMWGEAVECGHDRTRSTEGGIDTTVARSGRASWRIDVYNVHSS